MNDLVENILQCSKCEFISVVKEIIDFFRSIYSLVALIELYNELESS